MLKMYANTRACQFRLHPVTSKSNGMFRKVLADTRACQVNVEDTRNMFGVYMVGVCQERVRDRLGYLLDVLFQLSQAKFRHVEVKTLETNVQGNCKLVSETKRVQKSVSASEASKHPPLNTVLSSTPRNPFPPLLEKVAELAAGKLNQDRRMDRADNSQADNFF